MAISEDDKALEDALRDCASEPVHAPQAIQSSGCLVCLDRHTRRVLQVSENIEAFLGVRVDDALNAEPAHLLGDQVFQIIRDSLDATREQYPFQFVAPVCPVGADEQELHLSFYPAGDCQIIELEYLMLSGDQRVLVQVTDWLTHIAHTDNVDTLLATLTRGVRDLTGHDRVMVYRFDEEWNGSVVAESRTDSMSSFLGHHFPATDIPPQVRALYDINPVRDISDATSKPVPLVKSGGSGSSEPLDLSLGFLRAVSPIHAEYLANMGVCSSMSIAIHSDAGLWGLVACHGQDRILLPPKLRNAAKALVQAASQRLFLLHARNEADYRRQVHDSRELLSAEKWRPQSPGELVESHGEQWLSLFRGCGVALVQGGSVSSVGRLPEPDNLRRIVAWLESELTTPELWSTRELSRTPLQSWVDESRCCGMLAVPLVLARESVGWLMLFRPEQVETYRWAGKPSKQLTTRNGRASLSPRTSFAIWEEEMRGRSETWLRSEQLAAADLCEDLEVLMSAHEIGRLNDELQVRQQELVEANAKLGRLAHTDQLTQIANRYQIEQIMDAEIAASERYERSCAVLLFDIDHFKHFNDTYGHALGDQVLKKLARAVAAELRPTDALGRWGGEEFVVVAGQSDLDSGLRLAERLRAVVAKLELGIDENLSISVGVTSSQPGDSRKKMIARADAAMYAAKDAGRNQVKSDREA